MSDPTVVPPLLGLGTPTQISTKNRSHHKRRNPTKKTLTNATKLTPPLQLLNGWGDPLQSIDDISTLRVVYQNVNGFSKSDPSSQFICQQLRSIQCGVFLAAETNINWRNKKEFELFKSWGAKIWPNHRLIVACHTCGRRHPAHYFLCIPSLRSERDNCR